MNIKLTDFIKLDDSKRVKEKLQATSDDQLIGIMMTLVDRKENPFPVGSIKTILINEYLQELKIATVLADGDDKTVTLGTLAKVVDFKIDTLMKHLANNDLILKANHGFSSDINKLRIAKQCAEQNKGSYVSVPARNSQQKDKCYDFSGTKINIKAYYPAAESTRLKKELDNLSAQEIIFVLLKTIGAQTFKTSDAYHIMIEHICTSNQIKMIRMQDQSADGVLGTKTIKNFTSYVGASLIPKLVQSQGLKSPAEFMYKFSNTCLDAARDAVENPNSSNEEKLLEAIAKLNIPPRRVMTQNKKKINSKKIEEIDDNMSMSTTTTTTTTTTTLNSEISSSNVPKPMTYTNFSLFNNIDEKLNSSGPTGMEIPQSTLTIDISNDPQTYTEDQANRYKLLVTEVNDAAKALRAFEETLPPHLLNYLRNLAPRQTLSMPRNINNNNVPTSSINKRKPEEESEGFDFFKKQKSSEAQSTETQSEASAAPEQVSTYPR